eukprot:5025345-Ditylum_brightwellii.AAC.1
MTDKRTEITPTAAAAAAAISNRIAQINAKIEHDGGTTGPWRPEEHDAFLRSWTRKRVEGYRGDRDGSNGSESGIIVKDGIVAAVRKHANKELRHLTDDEIIFHA